MRSRKKKTSTKKLTRRMQGTLLFVFCVILAGISVVCGRLIYINAREGERYEKRVLSKSIGTNAVLPYRRGDILDRNGVVLAKSVKVYNVIFDPSVINSDKRFAEPTVTALASVYGLDERELYTMLTEKASSTYIRLLRQQSFERMDAFRQLAAENKLIKGVWFEEEYIRSYPFDSLASHVIGYTVAGDVGTWGSSSITMPI